MRWPIDVPILPNELLSSWVIRTAFGNGSYPLAWSWYFWGKDRVWTKDIDRYCPVDMLAIMESSTVTLDKLQAATLYPLVQQIVTSNLDSKKKSWPWITSLGARNRSRTGGLRFCPKCLASPPAYFRCNWRLAWNHSCQEHECILLDSCPQCSSSITPHKLSIGSESLSFCSTCGFDLCKSEVTGCSIGALQNQNLMNTALSNSSLELPWGIENVRDLFVTIRYLMSFLNRAITVTSLADNELFKFFGSIRSTEHQVSAPIERQTIAVIHSISGVIDYAFRASLVDFVNLLTQFGYTSSSFLSRVKLPISPQIQFILDNLPEGKKFSRNCSKSVQHVRKPASKAEVEQMWQVLKEFLI